MTKRSLISGASVTILFMAFFLVLFLIRAGRAEEKSIKIKLIEVKGTRRIDSATIRAKIKSKENDLFLPDRLREDLRAIYQMGYFDQVNIETEGFEGGVKVTFIVTEKPFISEIIFI